MLKRLSACGWSAYRLVKENQLGNGTITQIREGKPISTTTLNVVCSLCKCQPGELIRWEPDK
jgi:putative transcriptional regulator